MGLHWDIFCRVVDNYGDIGVCWRLARQLAAEHGLRVRLWVDDPAPLARLHPAFDPQRASQRLEGVEVRPWLEPWAPAEAADVVIEAFACELPPAYLEAMARRQRRPCWINLEYLSAESWVEDCHGLASPHPVLPLTKHFFFPGFTSRTGGLLREKGLLAARDALFPASLPEIPPDAPLEISLFCYDSAPIGELLDAWIRSPQPVRCRVPPGKPLAAVVRHLKGSGPWQQGNLEIIPIPFVAQSEFDRLLWECHVNFVRGEDSFIRAQWAARPFVWHIYPQEEDAHLAKLTAFLSCYTAGLPPAAATAVEGFFLAWNQGRGVADAWSQFAAHLPTIGRHGRTWSASLAEQGELAGNLVKFCGTTL